MDGYRRLARSAIALLLLSLSTVGPPRAAEDPPPPQEQGTPADREPPPAALTERVTVSAARLPQSSEPVDEVPAHVTVIDEAAIDRAGAITVQDLLASQSGVIVYDQVGNDVQKTLDLRGFTSHGTKVFLDGAPLNDPRNNDLALELVPLEALGRVEIVRGSTGALAGGGSEGGVIQLLTRRNVAPGGFLSLARGTWDASSFTGEIGQRVGDVGLFLAGSRDATDGFRENAGGTLRRLAGGAAWEPGPDLRLSLSLLDGSSDLGNPGALTESEFEQDPSLAPFNRLDSSRDRLRQASLGFEGRLDSSLSLAANVFLRGRSSEILTTGRSVASFGIGGVFLDSDGRAAGSTIQLTREHGASRLAAGVEWLDGTTDDELFFTPLSDPTQVDPSGRVSSNTVDRRTLAVFAQQTWHANARWTMVGGARLDGDRVGFHDRGTPGTAPDRRSFSEFSLRAGLTRALAQGRSVYVAYGESFLPPSAEELFAFPGFGSNPGLRPEDARSWEVGLRAPLGGTADLQVALFDVETRDEIVYDPASPLGAFGANVNAGRTRRAGIEAEAHARPLERLNLFAGATWLDARFRNGPDRGRDVPLVPGSRLAVGIESDLPADLLLRVQALRVGEQVLDNDAANEEGRLGAYSVVDARLSWQPRGSRERGPAPRLFLDCGNVFDRRYAGRGIAASGQVFLTPAPGRRYLAGVGVRF